MTKTHLFGVLFLAALAVAQASRLYPDGEMSVVFALIFFAMMAYWPSESDETS